jgi:hypothetical protein
VPSPSPTGSGQCSAKGCRQRATWALSWNNPRLHTPDRRKVWLACSEHLPRLSDFLSSRGFLREQTPAGFPAPPDTDGPVSQDDREEG